MTIPKNVSRVSPYLLVQDVDEVVSFLQHVFDATLDHSLTDDEGVPNHAQVQIGGETVMMGRSGPEFSMAGMIHVYVDDVDGTFAKAIEHGATEMMPPSEQFYGDRAAGVRGPAGNAWWIATQLVDYSPEELQRRSTEEHARRRAASDSESSS